MNPVLLWAAVTGILTSLIGGLFRMLSASIFTARIDLIHSLDRFPIAAVLLSVGISALMVQFSQSMERIAYGLFSQFLPEPGILTVAGMGALVAATVRAPLTAIVLTLEITANSTFNGHLFDRFNDFP
ncbi:MAG: chloride channel protein [Microcoleaceae cyanobacterium]